MKMGILTQIGLAQIERRLRATTEVVVEDFPALQL